MVQSVIRWTVILLALLVAGPAAWWLTGRLRAPDGGPDASLLLSETPGMGMAAGAAAVGIAGAAGVLGAWAIGRRSGLFCAGLVLAWAAAGTGKVDRIIARTQSSASLRTLALEGVALAVLGALAAAAIMRTPTRRAATAAARDPEHEHHHLPEEPTALWEPMAPVAMAAAAAAAGVAVWIFAGDTLKGQTVAAAYIGGKFGAAAGRMASPRASAVLFVAAVAILGAAAPAAAGWVHGSGLVRDTLAGGLFKLARPLPLDWLAGAFLGVPLGLTWAASMIERHAPGWADTPGRG